MIETKEKYKDYEIIINEYDNIKELIIGVNKQKEKEDFKYNFFNFNNEELRENHYYEVFEIKSSNEEITKKAKRIIENSK
tara:strand:- start:134 stop:373 length:240 start_codon:yes stop_codon:yes gene_type:complete